MTRPYVTITTDNKIESLLEHLKGKLPAFKALPGVIGITLNGGLSRGFGDHLSEIDITFYLDSQSYRAWHNEKSPIPFGIIKLDHILYDIKVIDLEREYDRRSTSIDLWDLSYAKILFDPNNKIEELLQEKLALQPELNEAIGLLWASYWNFKLAGDIWISRGDSIQGHFILNEAIKPLIQALYVCNKEYIPHEKWLVHMSYTLKWTPDKWRERLMEAMNTGTFTAEGLRKRQMAVKELWHDLDAYLKKGWDPGFSLATHQKSTYDLLKELAQRGYIPVVEFKKLASLTVLNQDPFYSITEIHEGNIVLDKEKMLTLTPEDMYSWHYEILTAVMADLQLI